MGGSLISNDGGLLSITNLTASEVAAVVRKVYAG